MLVQVDLMLLSNAQLYYIGVPERVPDGRGLPPEMFYSMIDSCHLLGCHENEFCLIRIVP